MLSLPLGSKLARALIYGTLSVITIALLIGVFISITYGLSVAGNDRDWTLDQVTLPHAEFDGNMVTIRNIRNFSYTSTSTYTPSYYDKTFNLDEISSVDFIVEPLKPRAVAHTFVSFGFQNGDYLAISVEIRKEKGEVYSPLKGLLDQFELMYVIADERDVLRLRAIHRKDVLLLYPTIVSKEKARELFVSMLTRANKLKDAPEFYNTLTSTCTTNIVDHINAISENRVPWDLRLILPLDSDAYAYELGLIDTSTPFAELRERQRIHDIIIKHADDTDFSRTIREVLLHGEVPPPIPNVSTDADILIVPLPDVVPTSTPLVKTETPTAPKEKPEVKEVFDSAGMLTAHNSVRKAHGVSPLTWSKTVALSAESWADTLGARGCKMEHDATTVYGENLYWAWSTKISGDTPLNTPKEVVKAWADEEDFYNYTKNTCKDGEQCGHYTQIVWEETTEVGCGVHSCLSSGKQTDIWVCRYSPPGNWVGEKPY